MKNAISDFGIELSIVIPCLNESRTLAECIHKAQESFHKLNISGEVVVADNGSCDKSVEIAQREGALVVHVEEKGYGNALRGGIAHASGKYIIMGDADCSYDFSNIDDFVNLLREGYDLVMGNRFKGGILPGAMSPLHRYLGNPVLSGIGRLFFRTNIGDFHCGLRGFSRRAYDQIAPVCGGMEFASELVIKSALLKLKMIEVPVFLYPDGRDRPPHLRSWHDGWRHLKLLLLYAPQWLFLYPAVLLLLAGFCSFFGGWFEPLHLPGITSGFCAMFYSGLLYALSFLFFLFYLLAVVYGERSGYYPSKRSSKRFQYFLSIGFGLLFGGILLIFGLIVSLFVFFQDGSSVSKEDSERLLGIVVHGGFAILCGIHVMLISLLFRIVVGSCNKEKAPQLLSYTGKEENGNKT